MKKIKYGFGSEARAVIADNGPGGGISSIVPESVNSVLERLSFLGLDNKLIETLEGALHSEGTEVLFIGSAENFMGNPENNREQWAQLLVKMRDETLASNDLWVIEMPEIEGIELPSKYYSSVYPIVEIADGFFTGDQITVFPKDCLVIIARAKIE